MLVLAIDTSGEVCTVALVDDTGLMSQIVFRHKMDLLRRLMPNVQRLISDCGTSIEQLDAVAVSLGPGSFTGLRVGVATAKSLAYAAGRKIFGIPTMDALAAGITAQTGDYIAPLTVARPGEVYDAIYRQENEGLSRIAPESSHPIEEFLESLLGRAPRRVVFCGSGARANAAVIKERLGPGAVLAPEWADHPRGEILGRLALDRLAAGESDDVMGIAPLYVRRPTPEIRMEDRARVG